MVARLRSLKFTSPTVSVTPRHVLEYKSFRLELSQKLGVMPEQLVPGVVQETLGGVDRKALAWGAADEDIKFTWCKAKLRPNRCRVHLLDGAVIGYGLRMVEG